MTAAFSGHVPRSGPYRRVIIGLFCAGLASFAQLYAPQSLLPLISTDLRIDPATAALVISTATLGLAAAVIPWSLAADRLGRVPAMTIGIAVALVCGFLAPVSGDLLLVFRLLEGAALGAVPAVALTYLTEEVDRRFVAAAAGSYVAGNTVGGLSGRLLAGWFGDAFGWRAGFWVVVGICAVSAMIFVVLIPRSQGFTPIARMSAGPSILSRLVGALRSPALLTMYAQSFLLMGVFVAVYNYIAFHVSAPPFLLPPAVVTMLFLAYLAGTIVSPWAGSLASRFGRYPVLLVTIAVMAAGIVLLWVPNTAVTITGLLVFTAGFFGAHAIASGWVPASASVGSRAQASSLYYFAYYAGSSLFGWSLGIVFGTAGWGWFVATALLLVVVIWVLTVFLLRRDMHAWA